MLALWGLQSATPAQAETLVSNLSGGGSFNTNLGRYAQEFTTGAAPGGYTVDSVTVRLRKDPMSSRKVSVWVATKATDDNPGEEVFRVADSQNVSEGTANRTFNAPDDATLAPSTSYFVVVQQDGGSGGLLYVTTTPSDAQTGATGWSIADVALSHNNVDWGNLGGGHAVRIKIDGETHAHVDTVTLEEAPAHGHGYGTGETISVFVGFNKAVDVTGTPRIGLSIGTEDKHATYTSSNTEKTVLEFRYTVANADVDSDGLEVKANSVELNGGTIKEAGTERAASLEHDKVKGGTGYRINAAAAESVAVTSSPLSDNHGNPMYTLGEHIELTVTFAIPVDVTGTPQLALEMDREDGAERSAMASYHRGTGTADLVFRYTVQAGDNDANGFEVGANSLSLSGGTIRAAGTTNNARIELAEIGRQRDHKVYYGPIVRSVELASTPASGDTYGYGEIIRIAITFSEDVAVIGDVGYVFAIGSSDRRAHYNAAQSSARRVVFDYMVGAGDVDSNGIWMRDGARAFRLGAGAEIRRAGAGELPAASPVHGQPGTQSNHKVNHALFSGPTVASVAVTSTPAAGDTYGYGELIKVTATFSENVEATGSPGYAIDIGGITRRASYSATESTGANIVFAYMVSASDEDSDGIASGSDAFQLGAGDAIHRAGQQARARLMHTGFGTQSGHKVDGTAGTPPRVSAGTAVSNLAQSATGVLAGRAREQLAQRFTTGANPSGYELTSVQISVGDNRAFSVRVCEAPGANPTSTCWTMQAPEAFAAGTLTFKAPADAVLAPQSSYAIVGVGGGQWQARTTTSGSEDRGRLAGWSIENGARYNYPGLGWRGWGAVMQIAVQAVTRAPDPADTTAPALESATVDASTLVLTYDETMDPASRPATGAFSVLVAGTARTVRHVRVRFDEVTLTLNPGVLPGETVTLSYTPPTNRPLQDAAGNDAAALSATTVANHTETTTQRIAVTSTPRLTSDTYGEGETIRITVRFSRVVTVMGTPHLAFGLGTTGANRMVNAAYESGSGTRDVVFAYTVQPTDSDPNGLWIGEGSGAMQFDAANRIVTERTETQVLTAHAAPGTQRMHKVDGSMRPPSQDATLSALSLGTGIVLDPPFSPDTTSYRAWVSNSVGTASITATKNDANATVAIDGDTDPGTPASATQTLSEGLNTITVRVSAEQTSIRRMYTVELVREASAPARTDPNALLDANITAGEGTGGGEGAFGYNVERSDLGTFGAITARQFTVGGTTYTVTAVIVGAADAATANVRNKAIVCIPGLTEDRARTLYTDIGGFFWLALASRTGNCYALDSGGERWARGDIEAFKIEKFANATSATVNGATLTVSFDKDLDEDSVPAASAFTVKTTPRGETLATKRALASVNPVQISGRSVILTLAAAVARSDSVTVSYDRPGVSQLQDSGRRWVPNVPELTATNETAASNDARLATLSLGAIELMPGFQSARTAYRAWTGHATGEVTASAATTHRGATIAITGDDDTETPTSATLALTPGRNAIEVTVTAEDEVTTETYTVTLVREAGPAAQAADALLTANLTVGGRAGALGFSRESAALEDWGGLAPRGFELRGSARDVRALVVGGASATPASIRNRLVVCLATTSDDPRNYADVTIGARTIALYGATTPAGLGDNCHGVAAPSGLGWAWGDIVEVKIAMASRAPEPPRNLTATPDGGTAIDLAWDLPENEGTSAITGYRIEWSPNGTDGWTVLEANTASTDRTHSDTGLGSQTTRHYRVSAINSTGTGEASESASATTDDIEGPMLEAATVAASGAAITLRFDEDVASADLAPTTAFAVTADGVAIAVGGRATASEGDPARVALRLTGLAPLVRTGQSVVVAYTDPSAENDAAAIQDAHGNDAPSFTTGTGGIDATDNGSEVAATGPDAPEDVTAQGTADGEITLAWEPPADNGGRVVTGYRIEVSADGGTVFTEEVANQAARGYVDSGLPVGSTRHYRVTARNTVGLGTASAVVDAVAVHAGAPSAPRTLTATASGGTQIDLAWLAPSTIGDSAVKGYRIEWSADGSSDWQTRVADTGSTTRSYADTGLASETERHYRVYAINNEGTSPPSNVAAATTDDIVAPEIASASVPANGATIALVFDEAMDETAAGAPPTERFTIEADDGTALAIGAVTVSGTTVTLALAGASPKIKNGQGIAVAYADPSSADDAQAVQDEAGNDAASFRVGAGETVTVANDSSVAATAPGAPTGLTARAGDDINIELAWKAPADRGGRPITGYRIDYSADVTPRVWQVLIASHGATSHNDTTTSIAETRHYRIAAINAVGTGEASAPAVATALQPQGEVDVAFERARVAESETATVVVTATTVADERPDAAFTLTVLLGSEDGTATAPEDYAEVAETLTFGQGDFTRTSVGGAMRWRATRRVAVALVDDATVEPDQTFSVRARVGNTPVSLFVTGTDVAEAVIANDDTWTVAIAADPAEAREGTETEVTLSARIVPQSTECVVPFAVTVGIAIGGSGEAETDYRIGAAPGAQTLDACASETLGWTVALSVTRDRIDDDGDTVTFTPVVEGTPEVAPEAPGAAEVRLRDATEVVLGTERLAVEEGESETYTVELGAAPSAAVTVRTEVSGSADITVTPQALRFTATDWNAPQTVTVTAATDANALDESAQIAHTVSGAPEFGRTAGTVAVEVYDAEAPRADGTMRLRDGRTYADESVDGRAEVAWNRTWGTICNDRIEVPGNLAPVAMCRSMDYATGEVVRNRNAGRVGDEVPIWLDDVRCFAGSTHHTGGAPVSIQDCFHAGWGRNNCDHDEDLWLRCSGTRAAGTPLVLDLPALTIRDTRTVEGADYGNVLAFAVMLKPPLSGTDTVSVDYATTSDGTATPGASATTEGADFVARSGTLTFTATHPAPIQNPRGPTGDRIQLHRIHVAIVNDEVEDSGETVVVRLSSATGAQLADGEATGVIFNDEALGAAFTEAPAEHDGESAFTVTLELTEPVTATAAALGEALGATGATIEAVDALTPDTGERWRITLTPAGDGAVEITLAPTTTCDAPGAVCTPYGQALGAGAAMTIAGPAAAPAIAGAAQVGQTLRAHLEGETPEDAEWTWQRNATAIEGASGATYTPVETDAGARLAVRMRWKGRAGTSAETAPVWPAPAPAPAAEGETTLHTATVTIGTHRFALEMSGYGRVLGERFGSIDDAGFDADGTTHALTLAAVNSTGWLTLASADALPAAQGLVAYWNGHRIEGFERQGAQASATLSARLPEAARTETLRYAGGAADGVQVALTLRRAEVERTRIVGTAVAATGRGDDGVWDEGETIEVALAFSDTVTLALPSARKPHVGVNLSGTVRRALYTGGSGTATLRFAHTVTAADAPVAKARPVSASLSLEGGTLTDSAGRAVLTRFFVAPWVTGVALAPDASGDGVWTPGESVDARLAFSEAVAVESGPPRVGITVAGAPVRPNYASGSGTATLSFAVPLPPGNPALSRIAIVADSLGLNGGTIRALASDLDAELAHPGTAPTPAPGTPPAPLQAEFRNVPATHAGAPFTVEVWLGAPVRVSTAAVEVSNGTVREARRALGTRNERWHFTIAPAGTEAVTLTMRPAPDCTVPGALCTARGGTLAEAVTVTVAGSVDAQAPFTVRLEGVPDEHDGATPFAFRMVLSKPPAGDLSYVTVRDRTVKVLHGGERVAAAKARRLVPEHNDGWEITVAPRGPVDITVSVGPFATCDAAGAVCAAGGEPLANAVTRTVRAPPGLAIADARVAEAPGAKLVFAVTLGRASGAAIGVGYATRDGTATAGEDYERAAGTLAFAPGETEKRIEVAVLDDAHDEGEETLYVTLSAPSGGNAWLADAEAVGSIENADAMPKAWLARFGRTVASQVLDAVEGRFSAGRTPGAQVTLAGVALGGASAEEAEAFEAREAERRLGALSAWLRGETDETPAASRGLSGRDFLAGTAFTLTAGSTQDGYGAVWGRGAVTRFDGREGELTLEGEATSAMLGADWTRERGTLGAMLSHSRGEGSYRGEGEGDVESTLTGLYPYGRFEASERVAVWGVAGYGEGRLTLTPEGQGPLETDMDLVMGAVGVRSVAVEAGTQGGVEIALISDAMGVRTSSGAVRGDGGNLAQAEANVTRLRLGLEGTWRGLGREGGATLVPTVELGLRHDGGDAETGFGLDVGGGLAWSDPRSGLTAEVRARGLLTHEADGFGERGIAGSLGFDPDPSSDRGFALTLRQTVGASASGGMDALLGRETLDGLAANDGGAELANRRLELEMGYGFGVFGDRFTATPQAGLGLSDSHREYRLGWRLGLARSGPVSLEVGVDATRREAPAEGGEAENALLLRGALEW